MDLRRIPIFIIFAGLLGLLAACGDVNRPYECSDAIGCVEIAPDESIKIGIIQALSGQLAPVGIEQARAIELTLSLLGNQLLQHPIELFVADSLCTPEGGKNAAVILSSQPDIIAALGTSCSGAATTAAEVISNAGMVMISGTNGAPDLTSVGGVKGEYWRPGYFRTIYNGSLVGQVAAQFVFDHLHIRKVATINTGDAYTSGYTDVFAAEFKELGGEIVLDGTIGRGDIDMIPILEAVSFSRADLIFFPIFQPEADLLVLQSEEVADLEDIIFFGAEGQFLETFITAIGPVGIGNYFVGPIPLEGEANDNYISEFKAMFGEPPSTVDYGYAIDATNLLLSAIESVAVQEDDGTIIIGRQALRDILYATSGLEGLTGTLSCDQYGDCGVARFNIYRLDDPTTGIEGLLSNVIFEYYLDR
ncbi:MAG: branched-chain amino acid ABC transporter substrate-binding protein [Anaerolineales bacterium]|nr:branched-chain amino acid ABC transporter substrate-binding protein [Chloroflexota bacterium]MBL6981984.1 branched-chain amino acid ABC transporter substrate-binding protein [Anaerolineales bacterium]